MLKLIQTEFLKLHRRKFILLMLLAALLMPFLAIFYFSGFREAGVDTIQFYKWTAFSYTPWVILPVVLGVFSTMLMYDEHQNDMLKQLWIIPISKAEYFFSKFIIVLSYSICFMLLTAGLSVLFGMLPGYITFEWGSFCYLLKMYGNCYINRIRHNAAFGGCGCWKKLYISSMRNAGLYVSWFYSAYG